MVGEETAGEAAREWEVEMEMDGEEAEVMEWTEVVETARARAERGGEKGAGEEEK